MTFSKKILAAPILVDTSEQLALPLREVDPNVVIEHVSLSEGDYTIRGVEDKIRIERKSAADLWGSVHSDHGRFDLELARLRPYDRAEVVVEDAVNEEHAAWMMRADEARAHAFSLMLGTIELNARIRIRFLHDRRTAAEYVLWALRSTLDDLHEGRLARCRAISEGMTAEDVPSPARLREIVLAERYGICPDCAQRPGPRPKPPGPGICRCGHTIPKSRPKSI